MPPVLIIHGNADKLVPYQQAESFVERCREKGVGAHLIAREGQAHGWADMARDLELFGNWFDRHLLEPKAEGETKGKD
jgi:dipeptidyl aminopeptidase/acylaminoacyl peptidase